MKILVFLVLALAAFHCSDGKIFSKCELVRKLATSFPRTKLADWNCLVKSESSYDSRVIGRMNADGSLDYGLFQISGKYWCKVGYPGGDCNIDCNSNTFLKSQINEIFSQTFFYFSRINRWWHHRWHGLRSINLQSPWVCSLVWMGW